MAEAEKVIRWCWFYNIFLEKQTLSTRCRKIFILLWKHYYMAQGREKIKRNNQLFSLSCLSLITSFLVFLHLLWVKVALNYLISPVDIHWCAKELTVTYTWLYFHPKSQLHLLFFCKDSSGRSSICCSDTLQSTPATLLPRCCQAEETMTELFRFYLDQISSWLQALQTDSVITQPFPHWKL